MANKIVLTEDELRSVGARLRDLRSARGWSQGELEKRSGVARETISRIESGARALSMRHIPGICKALAIDIDALFDKQDILMVAPELGSSARLKALRKELGLSIEDLAAKTQVFPDDLRAAENEELAPGAEVALIARVAGAVDRPIEWFFQEVSEDASDAAMSSSVTLVTNAEESVTEKALLEMLARQQGLLIEQQAMMERQRQDIARLTELLARQQEVFISERQFQQKLLEKTVQDLKTELDALKARPQRGRQQLLESPVRPGRAGEG